MSDMAPDVLRAFFERWQRLEAEKAAISDDLRELFAEMKGNGFDTKVARKVFRDKTVDQNERAEFEAIYDLYWSALSGPRAGRAREGSEVTTPNTSNFGADSVKSADLSTTKTETTQASNDSGSGQAAASIPPEAAAETDMPETADETTATAVEAVQPDEAVVCAPAPSASAEIAQGGEGDEQALPATNSRSMSISPLEPREVGGLKGFGFTVSFTDNEATDKPEEGETSSAPAFNTRYLKAQRGEHCKFSDKAYSCWQCNQADLLSKGRAA